MKATRSSSASQRQTDRIFRCSANAPQRANAEAVAALESSRLQKGWEAENKATTQNTRSHQTRMCKGGMKLELRGRISEAQQRHAPTYTTVGGTCSFRTQLSDDQHYTNLHSRWGRHGHQSGVGLCTNAQVACQDCTI